MSKNAYDIWAVENTSIRDAGLWKSERIITTPQSSNISTTQKNDMINMCSNNYLGLSDNEEVKKAAIEGLSAWGYGLSSVRFICGTQEVHKELEQKLAAFLGMEDAVLYSSCFDANGGLFECLLKEGDAIISDELNHASIIDGVRLSKATKYRYKNNDMVMLEQKLQEAQNARIKLIITDGVFSMDGIIADLKSICDLADKYGAIVAVDDSHATGIIGETGRGSHEYCGVMGRVDIITGTFGKALGGASGGFTCAKKEVTDLLRQRSRPYLFSNTLSPSISCATIKVLDMLTASNELKNRLSENTAFFRAEMEKAGFDIKKGVHPIVPVMVYDEAIAQKMAEKLYAKGVYAVGFFYPVVPKEKARVRTQVSAAHTREQLEYAVSAFKEAFAEIK